MCSPAHEDHDLPEPAARLPARRGGLCGQGSVEIPPLPDHIYPLLQGAIRHADGTVHIPADTEAPATLGQCAQAQQAQLKSMDVANSVRLDPLKDMRVGK